LCKAIVSAIGLIEKAEGFEEIEFGAIRGGIPEGIYTDFLCCVVIECRV
jgi:hypothetical protein